MACNYYSCLFQIEFKAEIVSILGLIWHITLYRKAVHNATPISYSTKC